MSVYVVDASVAAKWLLPEPLASEAVRFQSSHHQTRRRIASFFVGLALVWTIGCTEKTPSDDRDAGMVASVGQPTDDDYLKFAKFLERTARSGDIAAFNQAIDWDTIISRATTPIEGSKEFNALFASATKRDLMGTSGITAAIAELVREGGEFRFLRIHTIEGTKRLLFRMLVPAKPALDYFEFELARRADGKVVATDYYVFRSGELVSQTVRRHYRSIASAASKAVGRSKLSRQEMDLAENNRKVSEMQACSHAGNARLALEIYAQLPAALQNEKTVLLTRLEAANMVGGKQYDEAMQALRLAIPDDPCLDFVLVDYYSARHQYDEVRAVIDRLDARIGGDPYQDARRALSFLEEKKYKLARDHAQKAIAAEDTLLLPYFVLLQIALEEKDFEEVARLLTVVEGKSLMTFPELTTISAYAEFVKSPQYQTWLKKTKSK
jgi:tetratricopeptide (TPR) repeat protein